VSISEKYPSSSQLGGGFAGFFAQQQLRLVVAAAAGAAEPESINIALQHCTPCHQHPTLWANGFGAR
jgi:hypothetical protein